LGPDTTFPLDQWVVAEVLAVWVDRHTDAPVTTRTKADGDSPVGLK